MDVLTGLSGSVFPNAFALGAVGILAIVAFTKQRHVGVGFGFATLALGATIGAKNVAYAVIVSNPHHENDTAARHGFATALLWVALAELVIGVIVILIGLKTVRLRWLSLFALAACGFAATCMLDWRSAYVNTDASRTVRYAMTMPWAQWALLLGAVISGVLAIMSLLRQPKVRPQH